MKSIMLALAAMAFATLAPLALAAEGQGDNAEKQPTMAELKAKMNSISTEIAALAGTDTRHTWPAGLKFSDDTTLSAANRAGASSIASYTGAVRITKLK